MKTHRRRAGVFLVLAFLVMAAGHAAAASADAAHRDLDAIGAPLRPMPADPAIVRALARISPAQIQHTIATLVSFRNRSTLSSMATDLPPAPAPPPIGSSRSSSKSPPPVADTSTSTSIPSPSPPEPAPAPA